MNVTRMAWCSVLAIPPLAFLSVFYFYPLSAILSMSFFTERGKNLASLKDIFFSAYYLRIIWFTFYQATLSTAITLMVGLPGAYAFSRYRFRGKKILYSIVTIPFVLPTVVVSTAFQALLGPGGILNISARHLAGFFEMDLPFSSFEMNQGMGYILLAHLFYNYAIIFRLVGSFWSNLDRKPAESAQTLGGTGIRILWNITRPLLTPPVLAASLLVFIFCFSSFGVILILGGVKNTTIEVQIFREALHLFNLPAAAVLSLLQIIFTLFIFICYTKVQKKIRRNLSPASRTFNEVSPKKWMEKFFLALNIGFILIFFILPMAALILRSFITNAGFSMIFYKALFINTSQSYFYVSPAVTVLYSVSIATITVVCSLILGLCASFYLAYRKTKIADYLNPLFMLPLSTSAVTLGLGFIIALSPPFLNLRSSIAIFPIAHTLIAFPFVIRIVLPALQSLPQHIKEAAGSLGASPFRIFRTIEIPLLGKQILLASVFSFTVSLGEFGASAFIARPNLPTLSVSIFQFLGQPGEMNYGRAMAMSSFLLATTLSGFILMERFQDTANREF